LVSLLLDGIGQRGDQLGRDNFLELACRQRKDWDGSDIEKMTAVLIAMLPKVMSHVASQEILYPGQVPGGATSQSGSAAGDFICRRKFLTSVLRKDVGERTVADILCSKYAKIWLETGLLRTVARASEGLLNGTTQLSMTMSIYSTLIEIFEKYASLCILEMNQLRNLDVICGLSTTDDVAKLFGLILEGLPVPPLDELVLQGARSSAQLRAPVSAGFVSSFPFFMFVQLN
jgi:hypothetical protein